MLYIKIRLIAHPKGKITQSKHETSIAKEDGAADAGAAMF